jgi:hypothetical protein
LEKNNLLFSKGRLQINPNRTANKIVGIDMHHRFLESLLIRFIHLILALTLPDSTGHYFIFRAHGFGVADAGSNIVQHDIGEMESAAEYAGFYFVGNIQSTN